MKTEIINIRWTGDEYKVSLPDWEGGDVVTVEAHKSVVARQQSRVQELEGGIRKIMCMAIAGEHWYDSRAVDAVCNELLNNKL